MKKEYVPKRFKAESMAIIIQANEIIEEYLKQGFSLTLRQLYYQFVSRGYISNNIKQYNKLGSIMNDARLAGLVDWNSIVDRTRNVKRNSHWSSPSEILRSAAEQYAVDKRSTQKVYLEVWIEKDALVGVIEDVCSENDVPYFSCRGYTSLSEIWSAAQRIKSQDKPTIIIHLGDHDPSGLDMTRDIKERLNIFGINDLSIDRIALNYDQVEEYNPPPNPAKSTDSRFDKYVIDYGSTSWELDALNPSIIKDLIQKSIDIYTDADLYQKRIDLQEAHKRLLNRTIDNIEEEE